MIRIILCQTQHPGNIGAVARAMDVMGLDDLRLVNPQTPISLEAYARAGRSEEILKQAVIHDSLESALEDTVYVTACSARQRGHHFKTQTPRQTSNDILELSHSSCALVFGPERTGLTNEELLHCHTLTQIPCAPNKSLNLSHAVQLIAYEVMNKEHLTLSFVEHNLINHQTQCTFYDRLAIELKKRDKLLSFDQEHTINLLKVLFNRARLRTNEMNLLLGLFAE